MQAQSFEGNEEAYQLAKAEAKTHSLKVSLRDWMVASKNIYAELGQNVDKESFILFADGQSLRKLSSVGTRNFTIIVSDQTLGD